MFSKAIFAVATIAVAVTLLVAPAPANAQSKAKSVSTAQGGTEQGDTACRRDTRRLCRQVKAEEGSNGYLSCLQKHRTQLSKACKDVLKSHGL
jgi:hypothetical protein